MLLPAGTALKITGVLPQGDGLTSTTIRHATTPLLLIPRFFCPASGRPLLSHICGILDLRWLTLTVAGYCYCRWIVVTLEDDEDAPEMIG